MHISTIDKLNFHLIEYGFLPVFLKKKLYGFVFVGNNQEYARVRHVEFKKKIIVKRLI